MVPSGFHPIPINKTILAQDIGVKTQLNEMPPKLSSNVIFPQSIYETFTQSPHSGTKNSGYIYQSGHENVLPFFSYIGLSGPEWVSNDSFQFPVNATHKSVDVTYDFNKPYKPQFQKYSNDVMTHQINSCMSQSTALVSTSRLSPANFPTCQLASNFISQVPDSRPLDNDFNSFAKPASLNYDVQDVTGMIIGSVDEVRVVDRLKMYFI